MILRDSSEIFDPRLPEDPRSEKGPLEAFFWEGRLLAGLHTTLTGRMEVCSGAVKLLKRPSERRSESVRVIGSVCDWDTGLNFATLGREKKIQCTECKCSCARVYTMEALFNPSKSQYESIYGSTIRSNHAFFYDTISRLYSEDWLHSGTVQELLQPFL